MDDYNDAILRLNLRSRPRSAGPAESAGVGRGRGVGPGRRPGQGGRHGRLHSGADARDTGRRRAEPAWDRGGDRSVTAWEAARREAGHASGGWAGAGGRERDREAEAWEGQEGMDAVEDLEGPDGLLHP